jgi:cell division protein FtsL
VIVRVLNLAVIGALIMAAAYVYRIKYDSTVQAERLAKIRSEVRRERDAIAALRAEWGELESPARIEALAKRYLHLKPIAPAQFDKLNALPEQPPQLVKPDSRDPIGEVIENLEEPPAAMTGSLWPPMSSPLSSPASSPMPSPMSPPTSAEPPPPSAPAVAPGAAADRTAPTTTPAGAETANGTNAHAPITKSGRLDR